MTSPKKKCGFAVMDPERLKVISSKGGIAAHAHGNAHEWTTDEAKENGRKGGLKSKPPHKLPKAEP